ncbi:MAG: hypothetical protein K0S74_149 [Chlamydiales bacterium]|jgi:hypothetical protein|nr:hypothetical protein [Chlamydiales bacterium]
MSCSINFNNAGDFFNKMDESEKKVIFHTLNIPDLKAIPTVEKVTTDLNQQFKDYEKRILFFKSITPKKGSNDSENYLKIKTVFNYLSSMKEKLVSDKENITIFDLVKIKLHMEDMDKNVKAGFELTTAINAVTQLDEKTKNFNSIVKPIVEKAGYTGDIISINEDELMNHCRQQFIEEKYPVKTVEQYRKEKEAEKLKTQNRERESQVKMLEIQKAEREAKQNFYISENVRYEEALVQEIQKLSIDTGELDSQLVDLQEEVGVINDTQDHLLEEIDRKREQIDTVKDNKEALDYLLGVMEQEQKVIKDAMMRLQKYQNQVQTILNSIR